MSGTSIYDAVMQYAAEHYNDGGCDVVSETFTEPELTETVTRIRDGEPATTLAEALAALAPLVDVWADRQADARNSAFW